jgi:hypothetical protein
VRIDLPFAEAITLATSARPLPPLVTSLSCEGEILHADVDLGSVETDSFAMRLAFAAAGTVAVTAEFTGFANGVATFAMTAHARGLPAHKLVPYLLSTVNDAIAKSGAPEGVLEVAAEGGDPVVHIDVQRAIEAAVRGIRITSFALTDARILVDAEVSEIRRVVPEPS